MSDSTTETFTPNYKRRQRELQSSYDDESCAKPLDGKVDSVASETQGAQGCPIRSNDVEQKKTKKRKRNLHGDQPPGERECTENEGGVPSSTEPASTTLEQLDAEKFKFNFTKQGEEEEEEGKEANTPKRAKKKEEKEDRQWSWHADKESWSFKKKAQYWLLQNAYKKEMISKSDFKILLLYLESMQGNQRQLAIVRAQQVLDVYAGGAEGSQTPGSSKTAYKRAVGILRVLS
ncbi:hypothetical protein EMCRGX_G027629 [Ephydatia muelleri]